MNSSPIAQKLGTEQWYHQRFDGSPMYLSLIGEADTRPEKRIPKGVEARWLTCYYEGGHADGYLDMADIRRGAAILSKEVEKDTTASRTIMAAWKEDEERFDRYFREFDPASLPALSDEQLAEEFEKLRQLAVNRLTSTCLIDHFALGTDEEIAALLKKETGISNESDLNYVFSIATAPVHRSFINTAELALLHIATRVQQGQDIKSSEIQERLKKHQQQWFWIQNNYVNAYVLSVAYFEKEITGWLATDKDLAVYARELEEKSAKNKEAKTALFQKHQFSALLTGLLNMSEDFTVWQDERKRATYLAIHIGSQILQEMGKRRAVDAELLKYLTPAEVSAWFKTAAISKEELKARLSCCFVLWEYNSTQIFVGEEARAIRDAMEKPHQESENFDIRGLVASTGRAVGKAKIVLSSSEIGKVEQGDILIAVMTRPDYVPAMRKAAAIVTNEGGITCHAAIVSRELGLPCIIGTKIATKLFKDGDLIEVNGNHNWVRRIG